MTTLALCAGTLGRINHEIFSLQHTEILELEEPFFMGKVGSSTMPHKRNPAVLERPLSDELGRPAGDVCIRFSMIRTGSADGAPPIAWTTEYVRRDWIELIRAAKDFPHLLMIELIERLFRKHYTEVRQVIEARALPEEGARHLNAATGSPALRIVRNYVDESGEILLSTVSYHPGDRYAFNLNARVPEHKRNERLDETLFDRLRNGS